MAIKKIDSFNKHQNPSTNQNPFDVENYLNVNWDKAQETINNNADELKTAQDNISEIKQEQITQNTDIENINKSNEEKAKEIASLKTELEQTKTNLENYAIHGKESGEEIHLTDSSETDCRVDVRGNSKQVVREGKNVYNAGKTINDYFVTSGAKGNIITQYTAKDYVNCKIDKGVMTVEKYNTSGYNWISKWIEIDKNTDYTISLDKSTTSASVVGFSTKENNTEGVIIAELINLKKDVNFNSGDYAYYAVSFYPKQGLEIAIQIEKGKQKTTFEQYGASPSLDYPSKIETVGSNKNVFTTDRYIKLHSTYDTYTKIDENSFKLKNDNRYSAYSGAYFEFNNLEKNTDYEIGYNFEMSISNTQNRFRILGINSQNVTTNIVDTVLTNDNKSFNTGEYSKIQVVFYSNWNIINGNILTVKNIFVKKRKNNTYSKFGQGSVKVTSCNKNLFINTAKSVTRGGIDFIVNEDGSVVANGTSTGTFLDLAEILLKPGTYTFSGGPQNGEYNKQRLSIYNLNDESNLLSALWGKNTYTTTFKEETKVKLTYVVQIGVTLKNEMVKAQIEKGTTATEYEVHKEDSVVLPVQEEMLEGDYLDKVNKKEVHAWKKRIWNGTENWTLDAQNTNDEYISFRTQIEDMVSLNSQNTQLITDKITNEYGGITLNKEHLWVYGINVVVCIKKERLESLDVLGFKEYLTQNNVIVYYKLAEPKKLDLTQEQIQALEKLDKLKTYKNITNITTDSIAILDVDYKKDLETLLNKQGQI